MKFAPLALLSVAFVVTGCPSDKEMETVDPSTTEQPTGSSGDTDPTGSTGSTGSTESSGSSTGDTGGPGHVDLFGCGAPEACEPIYAHLDPEPPEALQCAAKVVTSTVPGVIRGLDAPGPDIDETDYFVLSLGDGKALVQTRERHCDTLNEACDPLPPWEPVSAHQMCDLVLAEGLAAACASDPPAGTCVWYPMNGGYTGCVEVADYTCDAVLALLQ